MPRYLLGSNCFVAIAMRAKKPPEVWFDTAKSRGIDLTDIYISAVTPMIVQAFIARGQQGAAAARVAQLKTLGNNAERLGARFVAMDLVAPVTKEIGDTWGQLITMTLDFKNASGEDDKYNFEEKLVIATAIKGMNGYPFTLLERRNEAHKALEPLGLVVEDPYESRQ